MAVTVDVEECTGCGDCVEVCPLEAISLNDGKAVIDDVCTECGLCLDECPNDAISVPG